MKKKKVLWYQRKQSKKKWKKKFKMKKIEIKDVNKMCRKQATTIFLFSL